MPTAADVIAHSLAVSQALFQRYMADLTAPEYLHRPTDKANCAAWTIGHVTLSDRKVLHAFGGELPQLPESFEHRFGQGEGCPQAGEFGEVSGLMPLFNDHRTRLIEAVRRATPEQLDEPLEKPRLPLFTTAGEMANFMAVHVAMHAGQITIIRRSLGRPPIV